MASFYSEKPNAPPGCTWEMLVTRGRRQTSTAQSINSVPSLPQWTVDSTLTLFISQSWMSKNTYLWTTDGFLKYNSGKTPSSIKEMAILIRICHLLEPKTGIQYTKMINWKKRLTSNKADNKNPFYIVYAQKRGKYYFNYTKL